MFHISTIERIAFQGLVARNEQIQKEYVDPLNQDLQSFFREVEQRLAIPAGSLGTRYILDTQTWTVKEREVENAEVVNPDESAPSSS